MCGATHSLRDTGTHTALQHSSAAHSKTTAPHSTHACAAPEVIAPLFSDHANLPFALRAHRPPCPDDAVVHLDTAAIGALKFYKSGETIDDSGNKVRPQKGL